MFPALREFLRAKPATGPTTRFVVVSLPRTGTHMLRTLLNQHPNIRTETELFNEHSTHCRKWRRRSAQWVLENVAWRQAVSKFVASCCICATAIAGEFGSI